MHLVCVGAWVCVHAWARTLVLTPTVSNPPVAPVWFRCARLAASFVYFFPLTWMGGCTVLVWFMRRSPGASAMSWGDWGAAVAMSWGIDCAVTQTAFTLVFWATRRASGPTGYIA